MIVYAFDVDDTLEIAEGPVKLQDLMDLRNQGHIVGLCGNWHSFVKIVPKWQEYVSFIGQPFIGAVSKEAWLCDLWERIDADEYVMVGNIPGVSGPSDDIGAAARAGWRFIKESDFAEGAR